MSMVKCPVCGLSFDNKKVKNLHLGNRYYHLSCCTDELVYTEKILALVREKWGVVSRPKIIEQIRKFKKEYLYTERQIYDDLYYFFEIKKSDTGAYKNTIGIVPFIHSEAQRYYLTLKIQEDKKENVTQMLKENNSEIETVYFHKQPSKKRLQFQIEIEEEG